MKIIFPFCIVFLINFPVPAFSQTKNAQKTDKQILDLLCHNWQLIKMETNGKDYTLPADKTSMLSIKPDGTLVETDQGTTYPGKWALSKCVMSVTNNGKGPVEKYKIIKITDTELIYETNEDGSATKMKMKRID